MRLSGERRVLPELLKVRIQMVIRDYKWQSLKDNFHNLTFGIDKRHIYCIVNPTSLINFLFPKGVVDGERPLKCKLDNTFSLRNLNPFIDQYPICFDSILKAFQRKKI
jgi:hypothetical protein